MLNKLILFFLQNRVVTTFLLVCILLFGLVVSPFGTKNEYFSISPISVDAIPDIGAQQQIVFVEWPGRSPQDIEDQIVYPLTSALLGVPGVQTIRSTSIFGVGSLYIIFDDETDFYWARSRILEKLSSLASNALPSGVTPTLGPDATALGQIFWYTLEGTDSNGNATEGWDVQEIRSIQDFQVQYALRSVDGVAEVASIGGFVQEYQVDINPEALRVYGISLEKVMKAVGRSNKDIGAKTIELNQVEYIVRGLGYIQSISDLEEAVVDISESVPIRIKDIAHVQMGPALRRGLLDKDGAEVVGGVVVARYGANPQEVIDAVKEKISEISSGLPQKVLPSGVVSQLRIVPFYDRSTLIQETLYTLEEALVLEVLVTVLVVMAMLSQLRASFVIASMLPITVLMVFLLMKWMGVQANIVALSGIAIAIGTVVDLGIILMENILRRQKEQSEEGILESIGHSSAEVSSALLTTISTTIVSFIPIFMLEEAEGKLFAPLAYTKTFALLSALCIALFFVPTMASWFFRSRDISKRKQQILMISMMGLGVWILIGTRSDIVGGIIVLSALGMLGFSTQNSDLQSKGMHWVAVSSMTALLSHFWSPLTGSGFVANFLIVGVLVSLLLGGFYLLIRSYVPLLQWFLVHKKRFSLLPLSFLGFGLLCWLGFGGVFAPIQYAGHAVGFKIEETSLWKWGEDVFPAMGSEFMPSLDEGAFLLMPTSMPHAGMEQNKDTIQQLDMIVQSIPEVELVVGKLGRVESALDPAPISMYENIIQYKSEYLRDEHGQRLRFRTDDSGAFLLANGDRIDQEKAIVQGLGTADLVADVGGKFYRNWRKHINSPQDIWDDIIAHIQLPHMTSSPKLQPIETRLVMLQTGMRSSMGIKVYGNSLSDIQAFGKELEGLLKKESYIKKDTVFADQVLGKPYLVLDINREALGRYGLHIDDIQKTIQIAIGGEAATTTVEGRNRYEVRVRYPREFRSDPDTLQRILIDTPIGGPIPLGNVVTLRYEKGPQQIKTEDNFLVSYVLFDGRDDISDGFVVEQAKNMLLDKVNSGELVVPSGVSYRFAGSYEQQERAEKRLLVIIPMSLGVIFLLLYLQFRSMQTTFIIFVNVTLSFAGGFILLWLYGQNWWEGFSVLGISMQELFHIRPINLSVAVWVGFIALLGIATDDGVLMGTYLDQCFQNSPPSTKEQIYERILEGAEKRIMPAVMTSATTIIALLPILSSTGRGADIMIPMAVPIFGGMLLVSISYFVVPVLYAWKEERARGILL